MNWDVILLPEAHEDRKNILFYLSGFYPSTPLKFDQELRRVKARLAYDPHGSRYPGNPEYHRVFIGKYTMFYKVDDEHHEVHIYRIIHSSWDIPKALHTEEEE